MCLGEGYSIEVAPVASKALEKLKKNRIVLESIVRSINSLAANPRPNGSKKLVGGKGNEYRLRDGEYRIVYEIDDPERHIVIFRIADRKDVYRK